MTDRILFVDDDSNLLFGFKRRLRKRFSLDTALNGKDGLKMVKDDGPYAVVVSDLHMPGMDGIEFLSTVRALSPDTVRIMLTGNADLSNAIKAVNEGSIFRFLTKPCETELLANVIVSGLEQYRLITAERLLLEKTLRGSIKVLTEVLSMLNPEAFGRASRLTRSIKAIASRLEISDTWQLETAAMLSQIGYIILPEEALRKRYKGEALSPEEIQLFKRHPSVASDLLDHIPRMQEVAEIIAYQEKHYDGGGLPENGHSGDAIPLGARILKVALDFDIMEARGVPKAKSFARMEKLIKRYDPKVLEAFRETVGLEAQHVEKEVQFHEITPQMIFVEDVRTMTGMLLVSRGQEVSRALIERLNNFSRGFGIQEPIRVIVPAKGETEGVSEEG